MCIRFYKKDKIVRIITNNNVRAIKRFYDIDLNSKEMSIYSMSGKFGCDTMKEFRKSIHYLRVQSGSNTDNGWNLMDSSQEMDNWDIRECVALMNHYVQELQECILVALRAEFTLRNIDLDSHSSDPRIERILSIDNLKNILKDMTVVFDSHDNLIRIIVNCNSELTPRLMEVNLSERSLSVYPKARETSLESISETENRWSKLDNGSQSKDKDIIMEAIAILNQYIKERSSIKRAINDSRDQWESYRDETIPNLIPSPNVSCSESAVEVTSYKCRIL